MQKWYVLYTSKIKFLFWKKTLKLSHCPFLWEIINNSVLFCSRGSYFLECVWVSKCGDTTMIVLGKHFIPKCIEKIATRFHPDQSLLICSICLFYWVSKELKHLWALMGTSLSMVSDAYHRNGRRKSGNILTLDFAQSTLSSTYISKLVPIALCALSHHLCCIHLDTGESFLSDCI